MSSRLVGVVVRPHVQTHATARAASVSVLCLALVTATAPAALAAPVELDTPSAHIIVVRPVDIWSGDNAAQSDSLEVVRSKKVNYTFALYEGGFANGGPLLFQGPWAHPVVNGVKEALKSTDFNLARTQSYMFHVGLPKWLEPSQFQALSDAQVADYKHVVLAQGDPDTLPGRISGRKVAGGILSVLTLGIAGAKFGAAGAQIAAGSGLAGDVYEIPLGMPSALSPAILPSFEPAGYERIDVFPVYYRGGMVGQFIIAYREPKTDAAETEALVKAVICAAGADTTPEAIEASRASDLAYRQSVWKECVAAGKCGPSPDKKADVPESTKAMQ